MKRVMAGMLLATMLMVHSVAIYAAEGKCDHNWVLYSMEKVYEGERLDCTQHEYCIIYEEGFNVIDICNKCGQKHQYHYTEQKHHFLSR